MKRAAVLLGLCCLLLAGVSGALAGAPAATKLPATAQVKQAIAVSYAKAHHLRTAALAVTPAVVVFQNTDYAVAVFRGYTSKETFSRRHSTKPLPFRDLGGDVCALPAAVISATGNGAGCAIPTPAPPPTTTPSPADPTIPGWVAPPHVCTIAVPCGIALKAENACPSGPGQPDCNRAFCWYADIQAHIFTAIQSEGFNLLGTITIPPTPQSQFNQQMGLMLEQIGTGGILEALHNSTYYCNSDHDQQVIKDTDIGSVQLTFNIGLGGFPPQTVTGLTSLLRGFLHDELDSQLQNYAAKGPVPTTLALSRDLTFSDTNGNNHTVGIGGGWDPRDPSHVSLTFTIKQ